MKAEFHPKAYEDMSCISTEGRDIGKTEGAIELPFRCGARIRGWRRLPCCEVCDPKGTGILR